nr:unknown [Mycobacterium marinum]
MPGDHRAAGSVRRRRISAPAKAAAVGTTGGRGIPGLGRVGRCRTGVDLRSALHQRAERPVSGPDRRGPVLSGDPHLRPVDPQRGQHHPRPAPPTMTGLGYTLPAVLAVAGVGALELLVLRTGLFRRPAYWLSMVIVLGFQVPVDGWLTKLSAPIVSYNERQITGLRFPFDIPIEDFLFGFAMVTAVLLLWERQREPGEPAPPSQAGCHEKHSLEDKTC